MSSKAPNMVKGSRGKKLLIDSLNNSIEKENGDNFNAKSNEKYLIIYRENCKISQKILKFINQRKLQNQFAFQKTTEKVVEIESKERDGSYHYCFTPVISINSNKSKSLKNYVLEDTLVWLRVHFKSDAELKEDLRRCSEVQKMLTHELEQRKIHKDQQKKKEAKEEVKQDTLKESGEQKQKKIKLGALNEMYLTSMIFCNKKNKLDLCASILDLYEKYVPKEDRFVISTDAIFKNRLEKTNRSVNMLSNYDLFMEDMDEKFAKRLEEGKLGKDKIFQLIIYDIDDPKQDFNFSDIICNNKYYKTVLFAISDRQVDIPEWMTAQCDYVFLGNSDNLEVRHKHYKQYGKLFDNFYMFNEFINQLANKNTFAVFNNHPECTRNCTLEKNVFYYEI